MKFAVKPYRKNNIEIVNKFMGFILTNNIELCNINFEIADLSARLRAKYLFLKNMDALQLSTSIYYGSDIFLTNDILLKKVKEIEVVLIEEFFK